MLLNFADSFWGGKHFLDSVNVHIKQLFDCYYTASILKLLLKLICSSITKTLKVQ